MGVKDLWKEEERKKCKRHDYSSKNGVNMSERSVGEEERKKCKDMIIRRGMVRCERRISGTKIKAVYIRRHGGKFKRWWWKKFGKKKEDKTIVGDEMPKLKRTETWKKQWVNKRIFENYLKVENNVSLNKLKEIKLPKKDVSIMDQLSFMFCLSERLVLTIRSIFWQASTTNEWIWKNKNR